MKSLLILILLIALGGGAFLSRPSQEDFTNYVIQEHAANNKVFFGKPLSDAQAKEMAQKCVFHDRFLWVDIEQDGKVIYTGAFSHFWAH